MLQNTETDDQKTKDIRLKINAEVQKYQNASISLSKPVPFIRFQNENTLNSHIADIMYDAAYILNQMTSKEFDFSKMTDGLPPEAVALFNLDEPIQQLKEQVEELSFDVENQSIQFDEATTTTHQIFSDQVIALQKEYQTRIAKFVIENSNEEEQMEKKLENLHDRLDQQLEKEFSAQIAERDEIRRRLISLKQKYEEANNVLNTQANLSTAAQKSNSQTSFSVSPPTSTAASIASNFSTTAKNHVSSINGDDIFTSSNDVISHPRMKKKGRARGMVIEKSMPTITRDRSLNASNDTLNANDNSDAFMDNYNDNNRVSSSLYYENTTEENSASLVNDAQIEEEEEYALSGESYENSNENDHFVASVNSADIDNVSEKNDIGYYNKRAEKANSEKEKLSKEMNRLQNYYLREKNRLHEDIIKARNSSESNVKKQLDKQKSNYQRKLKQFDELFKQRQKDLNKKIAAVEESKVTSAQKIRKEIEEKKKSIKETNHLTHSQISNIEKKMNAEIQRIENEIAQIRLQNENEIQELKNSKSSDNQTQKFPVRPPPQPPSSSPNSPSNSPRETSLKPLMKTPRRTDSKLDTNTSDIDSKLESFKRASRNELSSIDKAIKISNDQYNIDHQIQQQTVDAAKARLLSVRQKKEITSMQINYLTMILNHIKDNKNINTEEQQRQQVEELNQILQSMQSDKSEKVELQAIQNEMSDEKASELNNFESIKSKFKLIESQFNDKYNALLTDEKNRRHKQLKSVNSAQSEAEEQLKNAKKYINDSSHKDYHLSENETDKKNDEQQNQHTDPSVQRIQMESKCISSLPLLKH